MDATYSPHSPDLTGTIFSSPNPQQFRKQSISRQTFLSSSSPTTTNLADGHEQQFIYNYNSDPYATNFNTSAVKLNSPGTELLNESRLASYQLPEYLQSEPHNFTSTAVRHPYRPLIPNHTPNRTDLCANSQIPSYHNYHNNTIITGPEFIPNMSEAWAPTAITNKPHTPTSHCRVPKDKAERKPPNNPNPITQYADPNPQKIEIKTKFPVARIKRIMQADEEVGKVAQVTPVAVSKALELFMIALVTGAAGKAREKGSKKVNAQHLRLVVESQPERFDFLAEIVGKVADGGDGASGENTKAGRRRKEESESASDEDKEKGKKKGKGRKKKSGD